MGYNPKWIVVSNDDMYKGDEITLLKDQLEKIDDQCTGIVYAYPPTNYYSEQNYVSKIKPWRILVNYALRLARKDKLFNIDRRFGIKYKITWGKFVDRLLYKEILQYIDPVSFGILSSKMCYELLSKDGCVYDSTFINCMKESDLAIRIKKAGWKYSFINFKIPPMIGGTFGTSCARSMRDQAGVVYFSYKREKEFNKMTINK